MDDEEKKKPKISHLNIPSEKLNVHSTSGIPLHTRYTKQNMILIKKFRDLLFTEVFNNLNLRLHEDVISVIVLYTFWPTHAFTPWIRKGELHSPTMPTIDHNILSVLEPLMYDPNPIEDYEVKELVGRTLYGVDIHDSPYASMTDPNPCEIMTDQGGIFLVPDEMSNWYLNQDGRCIALPVRYQFKHLIAAAIMKSRVLGPYLQLIIKPIKGVGPGSDSLLKPFESSNVTFRDFKSSYSYSDINSNLVSNTNAETELVVDDPVAKEIAKSYRSTRESVFVLLEKSPKLNIFPSSHENDIKGLPPLEEQSPAVEGRRARHSAWESPLVIGNTSESLVSLSPGPIDETGSQISTDDEWLRGYFQLGPSRQIDSGTQRPRQLLFNSNNLSIFAHSEPTQSVLEIGPGMIGTDKNSHSQLYNRVTPNPVEKGVNRRFKYP